MRKKHNNIISLVMSFFMIFSVIFSTSVEVQAQVQSSGDKLYLQSLKRLFNEASKDHEVSKVEALDGEKITTFIVEIEDKAVKDYVGDQSLEVASKNEQLISRVLNSQKYFKDEIRKINSEAIFTNEYVLLINGFSVKAKMKDLDKIKNIKGIKHVSIEKEYSRDVKHALDLGKIQEVYREYGYKGEGMVISVIDSGIDYTHKDMVLTESGKNNAKLNKKKVEDLNKNNPKSKGRYYTEKVPYGYNFIDKNDEVIDKAVGNIGYMHGMHVAGIIGANCSDDKEMASHNGVRGVAPEAQLLAMKIFSNNPQLSNACEGDVIAAIEDSVAHGADVINMSISGSAGFQNPEDGQQRAIKEAINRGVMVVVAGGNAYYSTYPEKHNGINDTSTIGAPGIAHHSLQVASFNNSISTSFLMSYGSSDGEGKIPYAMTDWDIRKLAAKYEVVDCNLGRVDEKKSNQ
ncbi:Subtilase family protein [Hathewaya proteolytica DSM 3090]|uniref:Subtilase family protein n=1 Tax=Hathewaya proteolytica DSM 3090 TaxID=1121331 RepID=A0A1M6PL85_9CLOT|nr:S8 family serine peptidase [Hathewaya proteolytica]SHK08734.1 Subtilase family protein [Hathewaya proteolytica DSM 3090]